MLKQRLIVCPSLQSTTGIGRKTFHVITHNFLRNLYHNIFKKYPLKIDFIAFTNLTKKKKKKNRKRCFNSAHFSIAPPVVNLSIRGKRFTRVYFKKFPGKYLIAAEFSKLEKILRLLEKENP